MRQTLHSALQTFSSLSPSLSPSLPSFLSLRYTVIRDSLRVEVVAADVVAGDIVEFKTGNMFPCDGLLIHGSDVVINEASLTGETLGLKKHSDKDMFLYGGTQVSLSHCVCVCVVKDDNSCARVCVCVCVCTAILHHLLSHR